MHPAFVTKTSERNLRQNIRHLEVTGKVLARKIQKHAEALDTVADALRAPKRALDRVRRNPAPYAVLLGSFFVIYGFVGWVGIWTKGKTASRT